ncbi:S-layer homology domain-containing protein [Paenibacillus oceani]|uniref:S-layer homology domain-containing protein n=1 Tax=Paenibacillus oceani TaxID=2772510 RepID=A0A927C997_9BACL|nr:S-layer homology domain-containing protein [Paenibacillus oceani]MBD2862463.1 S-layer homology domain-containing protein [Paenibacillus oceani]
MSGWARDAIKLAAALGLLNGRDGGLFVPPGQLTRAEAIQVLSKLVK